jgi:glycosyltransferase involved in cell wall biosynthesis
VGEDRLDVLIVVQPATYGVAICVRQQAEAAVAAGHRVTVVCPGADAGPLAGWVERAGAELRPVALAREPALRDAADLWAIRRLARGRDLVHLHSSKAAALGRVATASLGRARPGVVVTPHYWSWLVGGRWAPVYRLIERALAPLCDVIVAVADHEAVQGRRVLGRAGRRITVIPNGVDRVRFSPDGVRTERDEETPLLVCAGRLSEQKGQDIAIRALGLMRHGDARLRFVGGDSQGGEQARLAALASSIGVAERIEWRGHVDDAAPDLRAADVVVAPSRWEGMSLVFLEALACGAPLVATSVSGSEAVEGAGVIVAPGDPRGLADAVDGLLDDPARRRELSLAARERSASYDLASTLRANLDLWARIVRARGSRGR